MSIVSLKHIVGKKKGLHNVLCDLIKQLNTGTWIEDEKGNILLGEINENNISFFEISLDDELLGWVKGGVGSQLIADLLNQLVAKEAEKKKLGREVLNMYEEINVIFNFTEALTQTIDPEVIAELTLVQAIKSIPSQSGLILLWDEESNELQTPSISGESLFDIKMIQDNAGFFSKIGLSGQSEIMTDISLLKEKGLIDNSVHSLVYAAMKVKHRTMGAIILVNKESDQFSAGELKLLVTLALQSSSAIESALLYEKNIREARKREEAMLLVHEVTKKFVPIEFIRALGREVLTDVKLGDQVEKIVTVLFTDIRDFTSLSEQMTPEENFKFVSSFNKQLGPIIRSHNGFINQYLGDSIMAIFPDSPDDALQAAIEMQRAVFDLNLKRSLNGLSPIKAGIGLHTGSLIMGITGDEQRMDAATISDTVNTASRIESLTKYYKSPLLISSETWERIINRDQFLLRNLGSFQLKGKQKPLGILECINGFSQSELKKKNNTFEHFNYAMECYVNQSFDLAVSSFQKVIEIDEEDHTAYFFMEKAQSFLENGIPENWSGAEEMQKK